MATFSVGPGVKVMVDGKMIEVESVEMKTWAEPVNVTPFGNAEPTHIAGKVEQLIEIKTKNPWSDLNSNPINDIQKYMKKICPDFPTEGLSAAAASPEPAEEVVPYYAGLRAAMLDAADAKFWEEKHPVYAETQFRGVCLSGIEQASYFQAVNDHTLVNAYQPEVVTKAARRKVEGAICALIGDKFAAYLHHDPILLNFNAYAKPSESEAAAIWLAYNQTKQADHSWSKGTYSPSDQVVQ